MNKSKTKKLTTAGILLAIIVVFQLIKNVSAFISGPAINTVLVIAAIELGIWWGIGFSVITPILSMLFAPASPMTMIAINTNGVSVPIIILGNVIFVLLTYLGYKKGKTNFVMCFFIGAILKWLFMWGCADFIIKPLFEESLGNLMVAVNKVFSLLQLYSGLLSGILIFPISYALKKNKER